MADAARDQPDEHLARPRLGQLELLHLERLPEPLQHRPADLHKAILRGRLAAVPLHGSCLCGGVRFELPDDFEPRAFCHCASCKKLSGGAGTANGRIASETFCRTCGSNLFGGGWPDSELASVRASAIDDPFAARPSAHIFVRSLAAWETLPDDGLERHEQGG
ncbi:MAG: GFA family protein [Actinobacteria bacterium]|nr:MAG: GFA family protein [Actinomycetota bacterium]